MFSFALSTLIAHNQVLNSCALEGLTPHTIVLFIFEDKSRSNHLSVGPRFSFPRSWHTHSIAEHTACLLVNTPWQRNRHNGVWYYLPLSDRVCVYRSAVSLRNSPVSYECWDHSCVHIMQISETFYCKLSSCMPGPGHSELR